MFFGRACALLQLSCRKTSRYYKSFGLFFSVQRFTNATKFSRNYTSWRRRSEGKVSNGYGGHGSTPISELYSRCIKTVEAIGGAKCGGKSKPATVAETYEFDGTTFTRNSTSQPVSYVVTSIPNNSKASKRIMNSIIDTEELDHSKDLNENLLNSDEAVQLNNLTWDYEVSSYGVSSVSARTDGRSLNEMEKSMWKLAIEIWRFLVVLCKLLKLYNNVIKRIRHQIKGVEFEEGVLCKDMVQTMSATQVFLVDNYSGRSVTGNGKDGTKVGLDKLAEGPHTPKRSSGRKTARVRRKKVDSTVASKSNEDDVFLKQMTSSKVAQFPFDGCCSPQHALKGIDVHVVSTGRSRFYTIKVDDSLCTFPSVTTILESTLGKERSKSLRGWELGQVKKYGKVKHEANRTSILGAGSLFHKNIEDRLREVAIREGKIVFPLVQEKANNDAGSDSDLEGTAPVFPQYKSYKYEDLIRNTKKFGSIMNSSPSKQINVPPVSPDCFPTDEFPVSDSSCTADFITEYPDESELMELSGGPELIDGGGSSYLWTGSNDTMNELESVYPEATMGAEKNGAREMEEAKQEEDKQKEEAKQKEDASRLMQSVDHVLNGITDIRALESKIIHFELGYSGTFDCIGRYKDKLCMIDWKTSRKKKATLKECYDYPLQLVAYSAAINHNPDIFDFKIHDVLLVIAYTDGSPADIHHINHDMCLELWPVWLNRLLKYQTMFASDLSGVNG